MAKNYGSSDPGDVIGFLKAAKGEALSYRQFFEHLGKAIPLTEALVVTSLPRGSLQITHPQKLPESLVRAYAKEFHIEDRPTWRAIATGKALRARDCWTESEFESTRYYRDFLQAHDFRYAAVAPLAAPALEGYPGALHVYRSEKLGSFSDAEVSRLARIARELDETIDRNRETRRSRSARAVTFDVPPRQCIFNHKLEQMLPKAQKRVLDSRLREGMLEYARFRLGHVNGKQVESDRIPLPDSGGDLWHFRVVVHRTYPALGDGPFVFFCLQPPSLDWSALRPADFEADAEVARLVPAMKYMRENFHRGITLTEISKMVHLSPFHFHRRFTEAFGITPKHFMLDCQIDLAKSELLAREKELVAIAKACGFAHQSHFTSRFKQATGLTPTRWRRMASAERKTSRN